MKEPEKATSGISEWIPEARLDATASPEAPSRKPVADRRQHRRERSRSRRGLVTAAAVVGAATISGVAIGVLASGGTGGDAGATAGADRGLDPSAQSPDSSVEALVSGPSELDDRVPIVARLTSLGPPEASLVAAAALVRDERNAARSAGDEAGPGPLSLSRVPYTSGARYQYFRRVGAVAAILARLGDLEVQAASAGTTDRATSRVRKQVDNLSLVIGRLGLSSYPLSRRLSGLVTVAILRLATLAAGDLDRESSAQLRGLTKRLGALGRTLTGDLRRAVAAASTGDGAEARRLLTGIDRRLGELAALP